jgi:hypothetical protein
MESLISGTRSARELPLCTQCGAPKNADVKQFCLDVNIIHIGHRQSSGEIQRRRNSPFAAAR